MKLVLARSHAISARMLSPHRGGDSHTSLFYCLGQGIITENRFNKHQTTTCPFIPRTAARGSSAAAGRQQPQLLDFLPRSRQLCSLCSVTPRTDAAAAHSTLLTRFSLPCHLLAPPQPLPPLPLLLRLLPPAPGPSLICPQHDARQSPALPSVSFRSCSLSAFAAHVRAASARAAPCPSPWPFFNTPAAHCTFSAASAPHGLGFVCRSTRPCDIVVDTISSSLRDHVSQMMLF